MTHARGRAPLAVVFAALLAAPAALGAQVDVIAAAEQLLESRQYAQARELLEPHTRRHPQDARAAFLLGRALLSERRVDDGIEWLEKAVKLDARNSLYRSWLGNAYGQKATSANPLQQARLARRAKAAFEAAVSLDPDNLDARFGLLQFHLVAPGIMGGDRNKAREHAEEIRKRNPYRGIMAMVSLHTGQDDHDAALAELEAGLRSYPDSAALYIALSGLHERAGRIDASFDVLEDAVRQNPESYSALYQIGRLGAVHGGRLERAEQAMRLYLGRPPEQGHPPHAAANWRLGMILERLGRTDDARAAYREALRLDPEYREASVALGRLGG